MQLLVTGGAGFIGSNFIRYILQKYPDYEIVNYDKLTYAGNLESLKDLAENPHYQFVKGDIVDRKKVKEVIGKNQVSHIVHFAAESHVDRSITGPAEFILTNVVGTQVLLDVAVEAKIKHFHHISTDEVFGALALEASEKFNENTVYAPRSPYSASKAASDHLVRAYGVTYGVPMTITNCSNNFGPYQDVEKFIPRVITNLIDEGPAPVYGDGKYVRDWLYVEDHCRAIDLVLHKGKIGETYLVGGLTEDVNNFEIARKIIKIFGKSESSIKFVKDRPGHDRKYAVDWSKIKRELGWKPKYDFDTQLTKTIDWYRENEWWWRPQKGRAENLYKKTGQI